MKKKKNNWLKNSLLLIMAMGIISVFVGCPAPGNGPGPDPNYPALIELGDITNPSATNPAINKIEISGITPVEEDYIYVDNRDRTHEIKRGELRGKMGTVVTINVTYEGEDKYEPPEEAGYRLRFSSLRYDTQFNATPINTDRNKLREPSYTFSMPAEDVKITARFEIIAAPKEDLYAEYRAELQSIISSMDLTQKIGQMTQASMARISSGDVERNFLGSVLSGGGQGPDGMTSTVAQWRAHTDRLFAESLRPSYGTHKIPYIYGIDAVHGQANAVRNSTVFPHNIGMGAIYVGDPQAGLDAIKEAGRITKLEMLACGTRWNFGPVLGVAGNPRWGRTYECFSEREHVVTAMTSTFIESLQTDRLVGACMKHFVGEGQVMTADPNKGNANFIGAIGNDKLEELYLPYIAGIERHALSAMASYNHVNGTDCHVNTEMLTGVLKGDLNFQGFIVSDWGAVKTASPAPYKNQIERAFIAGIDMIMAAASRGDWVDFIRLMRELVNENRISEARVNEAVERILLFKKYFNILGTPQNPPTQNVPAGYPVEVGTVAHRASAKDITKKTFVMLKNKDDVVGKLSGSTYQNILIAGEGASNLGFQCGGWTITWQGVTGNTGLDASITIERAIRDKLEGIAGKNAVYSRTGTGGMGGGTQPDAIIAVVSETTYAETEGDDLNGLRFRNVDTTMLSNVREQYPGKPVIVVVISGRPMAIRKEPDVPVPPSTTVRFPIHTTLEGWDGLIAAWLPGSEGGPALAEMLFDSTEDFTGRTAYTWRETYETVGTGVNQYSLTDTVTFPYGYGLKKGQSDYEDGLLDTQ